MLNRTVNFINYTIGSDALLKLEEICKPFGKNALIIGGKTALSIAKDKIVKSLSGFNIVDITVYGTECTYKTVDLLIEKYKNVAFDFIIAVGGGKALDTCKCFAFAFDKPFVTVPTLISNCAASSSLSVMYDENHVFVKLNYHKSPANHCFMDMSILFNSPKDYFRAGIGDTFAKYFEVEFTSRNQHKTYEDNLGIAVSAVCGYPLINNAKEAFNDFIDKKYTEKLEIVSLIIVVNTGIVSALIKPEFNSAIAHGLFYALTTISGFEENNKHGDVVAYGVMVQLMIDGKKEDAKLVYDLLKAIEVKTSLNDMGVKTDNLSLVPIIEHIFDDLKHKYMPYAITKELLLNGIREVEKM